MNRIKTLIENWKRESRLSLTLSKEDPSEYADGYARAMGNCAIRLEELVIDIEEREARDEPPTTRRMRG